MSDQHKNKKQPAAPLKKEDIQKNPDEHIDQDFPGFPHPIAREEVIKPHTPNEKATAGVKQTQKRKHKAAEDTDESSSDGSGNAFERTERIQKNRKEDHDTPY